MTTVVEPMKKITVTLLAGTSEGSYGLTPVPVPFDFIYGIGRLGLTPFEQLLEGKIIGDSLSLAVVSGQGYQYFGTLYGSIASNVGIVITPPVIHMNVEITAVAAADNREVVKALAESLGHGGGCGGDCDCGCS